MKLHYILLRRRSLPVEEEGIYHEGSNGSRGLNSCRGWYVSVACLEWGKSWNLDGYSSSHDITVSARLIHAMRVQNPKRRVAIELNCVTDVENRFVRTPSGVIEKLDPLAVLCMWDDPARIYARRNSSARAPWPERSVGQLEVFQREIISTCQS